MNHIYYLGWFQLQYHYEVKDSGQYIVEVVSLPDPGDGYRGSAVTAYVNVYTQNYGKYE